MKYREKMKRLKEIVRKGSKSEDTIKFVEKCTRDVRAGKYAAEVLAHIKKYSALQDRINKLYDGVYLTEEDMDIIEEAAVSIYDVDRDDAAELLIKANSERAKKLLYKLAEDKWDSVRASAYDSLSLGNFCSEELYVYFLKKLDKEPSRLARSYIISNLIDMYKENGIGNREEMLEIFTKKSEETESIEKAVCLCLLVILGEERYINDIFEGFACEEPYVRLWYLIATRDIANKNNYEIISEKVKEAFKDEKIPFINEQLEIVYGKIGKIKRDEDFKSEILAQIAQGNDALSVREVLIKYRDLGINKDDMLEMLKNMRKNSDIEDLILELMDMVTGFCRGELEIYQAEYEQTLSQI